MDIKQYVVPERLHGVRLDKALTDLADGFSRARVRRAIDAHVVHVDGRRRAKGALVSRGETIRIAFESDEDADTAAVATPEAPLTVLFESESMLAVEKPSGQPTAPLRPKEVGTLANALLGHYPELATVGYGQREPGLVHRLDTDTSGIVLVARTTAAFDELKSALKSERLIKHYLLICTGMDLPDVGSIQFPLTPHPKDQRRVYACAHPRDVVRYSPRPASTSYFVESRNADLALVRVEVSRALRHQIRAHFAAIGHPLVGDTLYGGGTRIGLARHALHASRVRFEGRGNLPAFDVKSPLPAELASLLVPDA